MIAELLVEVVGGLLVAASARKIKRWREASFFDDLSEDHKRPFLEIVIAAILHDGVQGGVESDWLERRRASGANDRLVNDALAAVRAALPAGSNNETFVAFVTARAEHLATEEQRSKAFDSMAYFLLQDPPRGRGTPEWSLATEVGVAFGLSDSAILVRLGFAAAPPSV